MTDRAPMWDPAQDPELRTLFEVPGPAEKPPPEPGLSEILPNEAPATAAQTSPPLVSRTGDPRELEEWFQKLPDFAQDEVRARWRKEAADRLWQSGLRRELWRGDFYGGAAVFGLVAFLSLIFGQSGKPLLLSVAIATALGGASGYVLGRFQMGRVATSLVSGLCWIVWILLTGLMTGMVFWHMWELVIVCALATGLGMQRESRRMEGYGA